MAQNLKFDYLIFLGFYCQNKKKYLSTLCYDKIFILQSEIFSTQRRRNMLKKIRENVGVDKKKVLTCYMNVPLAESLTPLKNAAKAQS